MFRKVNSHVTRTVKQVRQAHHQSQPHRRTVTSSTSIRSQAAVTGQASPVQHIPLPRGAGDKTVVQRELVKMPTLSLVRGLALLSVMGQPRLMNVATKLLRNNIKLLTGNRVSRALLDQTFYWHFCAGATAGEIERTCNELKALGYKGVVAMYAREIDMSSATHRSRSAEEVMAQHRQLVGEWMDGSLRTIACVKEGDFIALKLTGAGTEVVRALEAGEMPDEVMSNALRKICDAAAEKGVKVTVDAEHYIQQKAIDAWTLDLMKRYNRRGKLVVYNTYQMYLKQSTEVLQSHLALAEKEGFNFGVKLVRGAYINSDPRHLIHDTQEDTNKAYDDAAAKLATYHVRSGDGSGQGPNIGLVLATHNRESIRKMRDLRRQQFMRGEKMSEVVYAQLMGMADELSLSLTMKEPEVAEETIQVFKYFVWGTTEECMLYLLRRAEENKDAAQRTAESQRALWNELKARALPRSGS
ncbi:proline dehydrogenase [Ascosphaera aggregata]|nr:proline dehydrogenase [Ascosphaera aggregata]